MSSEVTESPRSVELLAWLELNKKPLIIAGISLVVLGIAISLFRVYAKEQEQKASAALHAVEAMWSPGATPSAPERDPKKYLEVAADFSGTDAAGRALLLGASTLFSQGDYGASVTAFDQFLAEYPHLAFASTAAFGKASGLDAQGETDSAVAAYQSLIARYPNSPEATRARVRLGGIYETRAQNAEAIRLYDEVIATAEGGSLATEAGTRRESLLLAHPDLAPAEVVVDVAEEVITPEDIAASLTNATKAPAEQ